MKDNIIETLVKSNVKLIQIITFETLRVHGMLVSAWQNIAEENELFTLYKWSRVEGVAKWNDESKSFVDEDTDRQTPDSALDYFNDEMEQGILLLEDFHFDLNESNPRLIKTLRNIALSNSKFKSIVFSQPYRQLPRDLEKEVHIIELEYPDYKDLKFIYESVCSDYGIENSSEPDKLIESALGLTIMEAQKAFSMAYIQNGKLTNDEVESVIQEKENVIRKSGYLEYYHPNVSIADIGGLDNLKDWLTKRGKAYDKGAKEYGLTFPKGILLLGIPGTGKSLTAKAIGNMWRFPLLRLDMGKIFGGIVGESESNIRQALNIAEAISPSILWIDEIEKGMSGISSSGATDGGTTARVLGTFLTWMQEKSKPVFVVATANNISQLPPELLRKGRVDEIFFVDLPTKDERKEIIKIHLERKHRDAQNFDIDKIAQNSKGFSGAELEEAIKEALFQAFDNCTEVNTEYICEAIDKTYPLSQTMSETITQMRKWAKSRAVSASTKEPEQIDEQRSKDVPQLKQEKYSNPFIK